VIECHRHASTANEALIQDCFLSQLLAELLRNSRSSAALKLVDSRHQLQHGARVYKLFLRACVRLDYYL